MELLELYNQQVQMGEIPESDYIDTCNNHKTFIEDLDGMIGDVMVAWSKTWKMDYAEIHMDVDTIKLFWKMKKLVYIRVYKYARSKNTKNGSHSINR